ncbi:uncharacterized protein BDZ99DRAFT_391293 [Mytilinidion resinicola]|uniref:Uncharacterized protein n=1 Tax=Mytilinidion resinicola TaxID=574789 RepID=A0A6A6YG05_9PEZI|nr:uncharacterized protein BDZ99DRAFT_391293 [Mytilinidion resinicola]KAF2807732.1 hypothetical protein BDZ99DRAFT_391293 [Mytilinidion resinicola]
MKREVPQEHSHNAQVASVNTNLKLNNPDNIVDAIFGLLGNAAGAAGQGDITDTDCLQQATADQAFTNAKAAGDVQGMTDALIYRGLERNTGSVGLASVLCTSVKAVNPEIAAISQHQDPASTGAAATNKAITLEIAKQIASIGGNPQDALKAGTFAPGKIGDPTAAGNTCDTADDTAGCIFSQNLIVEDATADEITAAVAGIAAGGAAPAAAANSTAACPTTPSANETAPAAAASASAAPAAPAATTGASKLDFGSCSNPTIVFGPGFDGRKEDSFEPADTATFTHGSALNIGVISDFICQQLDTKCKAGQDALDACTQTQTASAATTGQAAADAFNAALGFGAAKAKRVARAPTMVQASRLRI